MSYQFHVGAQVVCIGTPPFNYRTEWPLAVFPHAGGIYTIRAINTWPTWTALRFEEVDNRGLEGVYSAIEPGFNSDYFRPVKRTRHLDLPANAGSKAQRAG